MGRGGKGGIQRGFDGGSERCRAGERGSGEGRQGKISVSRCCLTPPPPALQLFFFAVRVGDDASVI